MNYHKEARKVRGFDLSKIPAFTQKDKDFLKKYEQMIKDKNPEVANFNDKYFKTVMLQNANRFKDKANRTPSILSKIKYNYEDTAEANYLAYLSI